jgi:uncharacterized protein YndB with AHSA1/START domain
MAIRAITPDQDTVTAEVFIAVPPDRVFEAITDPNQLLQWWGQEGVYRTTEWQAELRVGGSWRSSGVSADGRKFQVSGEYLEVDRPRVLVYTWVASWTGDLKTTVRWELAPSRGGTLLKIHHGGFSGRPGAAQDHSNGWQRVLGWMQAFVEKGETIDSRKLGSNVER